MVVVEEDGFVVERTGFSLAPPNNTTALRARPKSKTDLTDPLSTVEYVVAWLLLLGLHGLCASYLLAMSLLYFFMENPLMAYYANLLALPQQRYFRLFGTLVGILGALHGIQLILHLLCSMKARVPAVFPRANMTNRLVNKLKALRKARKAIQPAEPRSSRSRNSINAISSITASGLQDVLSVEGNHFALVFVVRKAAEASAQIVQCHRYSTLIGRVWINQAYAAMVVANCWATPLLDYLMLASDKRAVIAASTRNLSKANVVASIRERTLSVSVDMLLTIMISLVLPLAIFVPYANKFDATWYGFSLEMLYGDVTFINLVRENQALFALNFVDGVTKFVPHLSIVLGTASMSLILELYPPQRIKNIRGKRNPSVATSVAVRGKPQSMRALSYSPRHARPKNVVGLTFLRRVATPFVFVAAGAVVLGLHFQAAHLAATADSDTMIMCRQGLRPWFAVNVSCSVLEYNCYKHNVVSPPSDSLDRLQRNAVTAIIFEHCTEFEMPPSIRHFPNLLGLELWNISITKWGVEAALNADLHPKMIYLVMAYTNMTAMPQGLLTKPLPPLLGDIEISITNLTVIPDELADAWSNVRLVYLEHTPLTEFPIALFKIPSLSVSLLDDGLETIPEDLFTTVSLLDEYLEICFSYNPIKALPSSIRDGLLINYLDIDHTELPELPVWVDTVGQWMSLGGTPVCNDTKAHFPAVADCTDSGWNPMGDGKYPLALVAPYREIV